MVDTLQQRPWTLAPGDFNRDGRQDILLGIGDCCAGIPSGGAFALMLGNGDGTFQPIVRYINPNNGTAGTGNIQLATIDPVVADFNGDGKPDMASMFFNNIGGTTQGLIVALNTSGVVPANPALGVMSVAPASVVGGTRAEVNVPLAAGTVATSNISFTLSNNNPSVASFPFTITAPPLVIVKGMTNLHFLVDTNTVTTPQTVTITVNNKSLGSRSVTLTVRPPTEPLAIGAIEMQPRGVFGGDSATGVVRLVTGYVAPTGGALVTLTNDSASLITMPASVTIPAGQASAEFQIQTTATGVTTPVTVSGSYGGVMKSTTLTVSAPSQPVPISSVTLTPGTVVGGSNIGVRALVTLASGAPTEGANIMLTSSRPDIAAVPRLIRINFSGQTSAFTDFATAAVSAPTQVIITATFGGSSQSAVLNVTPPAATAPAISSLTLNPASVAGGTSAQGTITLSAAATSPTTVTLASSSAPIVTVASSVTIPAGAASASFTINTASVSSQLNATITASLNGVSRTATLTVTPAGDTVRITRAEYTASNRTLRVEATSTRTNATLQVFITSSGQLVGTLANNGGGKYGGQLNWSVNPQNITVRSSFGGSAQSTVAAR